MQEQMNPTPAAKPVELKELETEINEPKEKEKEAKAKAADDCCAPVCGPSTCG